MGELLECCYLRLWTDLENNLNITFHKSKFLHVAYNQSINQLIN